MDSSDSSIDRSDRAQQFLELYSLHQRQLYYYVVTLCTNADSADEVLAETNLAAWKDFDQFEPGTSFVAWIRQIARHRVLTHHRKQFRDTLVLDPRVLEQVAERLQENDAADELLKEALKHCLSELKDADRELIQRRYEPDSSVKSLAAGMSRSPNALSKSLGRIRGQLYDCIRGVMASGERGGV